MLSQELGVIKRGPLAYLASGSGNGVITRGFYSDMGYSNKGLSYLRMASLLIPGGIVNEAAMSFSTTSPLWIQL